MNELPLVLTELANRLRKRLWWRGITGTAVLQRESGIVVSSRIAMHATLTISCVPPDLVVCCNLEPLTANLSYPYNLSDQHLFDRITNDIAHSIRPRGSDLIYVVTTWICLFTVAQFIIRFIWLIVKMIVTVFWP